MLVPVSARLPDWYRPALIRTNRDHHMRAVKGSELPNKSLHNMRRYSTSSANKTVGVLTFTGVNVGQTLQIGRPLQPTLDPLSLSSGLPKYKRGVRTKPSYIHTIRPIGGQHKTLQNCT